MNKRLAVTLLTLLILLITIQHRLKGIELNYETKTLKIERLSEHTFRHISYLETTEWGNVSCNGMIVVEGNEAIIFDTPVDNKSSQELIDQLRSNGITVIAVVPTHFHSDCVGGLEAFKIAKIPIYISKKTFELLEAKSDYSNYKFQIFDGSDTFKIGQDTVEVGYFGAGHTLDNIVAYFPKEQVLFGGCLVKELGAYKGNLADANVNEWSKTVERVKNEYKNVKVVVPGHGTPGGSELLDYTIQLFEEK
jgi:metallo-beta-lactamase class B